MKLNQDQIPSTDTAWCITDGQFTMLESQHTLEMTVYQFEDMNIWEVVVGETELTAGEHVMTVDRLVGKHYWDNAAEAYEFYVGFIMQHQLVIY